MNHLIPIPEHMRTAVADWVERAEPHPDRMGSFLYAILTNNFIAAVAQADEANRACLREWGLLLSYALPPGSWGSREKLVHWHRAKHP